MIPFFTVGSRKGLKSVVGHGPGGKKDVDPKKKILFCYRKKCQGRQPDQQMVLDLVESIIRPTDPAKDELRLILFNIVQFRPYMQEFRLCTSWTSRKCTDSCQRPAQPASLPSVSIHNNVLPCHRNVHLMTKKHRLLISRLCLFMFL